MDHQNNQDDKRKILHFLVHYNRHLFHKGKAHMDLNIQLQVELKWNYKKNKFTYQYFPFTVEALPFSEALIEAQLGMDDVRWPL